MNVHGIPFRTIWLKQDDPCTVMIIDQRKLPHQFVIEEIQTLEQMKIAIKDMHLRGAGLIGAAAAYGMYLATLEIKGYANFQDELRKAAKSLKMTRPTAVNLAWAVNQPRRVTINCAQNCNCDCRRRCRELQKNWRTWSSFN